MSSLKERSFRWMVRCQLGWLWKLSRRFQYQPKAWLDQAADSKVAVRSCVDRLKMLEQNLNSDSAAEGQRSETVLDIGSNGGYFLIRLAQWGYCTHGIERDMDMVYYANAAAFVAGSSRVSCECAVLNEEYLARQTPFDIVLNFSVMHHVIMHEGLETATRILTSLAKLTRQQMFFEMGHSEEKADWASKLPKMEPNPENWIANWLRECGFEFVEKIGGSQTTAERPIFRCSHDQL